MAWDIITKPSGEDRPAPNLRDYAAMRAAFSWEAARADMAMPAGLNIAYHALDRHVTNGLGDKLALRWLGKSGERRDYTYSELLGLSNRFANLLRDMGVGPGERVFSLLGRIPELMSPRSAHCTTAVSFARCFRPSDPSRCAPA